MIHKKTEKECPECKEVFSYLECSEPHLCDTCTFPWYGKKRETEPQPTSLIRRLSIFFGKIIKR